MRILIIDSDHPSVQSMELMLKSEGHHVESTDLGEEGIGFVKDRPYDLILLDLVLPDMSGFDVLRDIRVTNMKTPIIIVSGSRDIETKVRTFGAAADAYLEKPFNKTTLIVECERVVIQAKGPESTLRCGEIELNLDRKTVKVGGASVHITRKEFELLSLLMLRKDLVVTKEMFLEHLYPDGAQPELKIFDVFVCKIRKKLAGANNGDHYIETEWGRGYSMREPRAEEGRRAAG